MEYEAFKNLLLEQLHLHFQGSKDISIHTVKKINGIELEGVVILDKELNIAPTIYLDYYFEKYQEGAIFQEVFEELLDNYEATCPSTSVDVSFFTDFEKVKECIVYKIINYEKNKELLEKVPHIPFLDLAVVFYCLVYNDDLGNGSILIYNQHLERWNVTALELMELASINTPALLGYELKSINSILYEESKFVPPDLCPMYVLTNKAHVGGACCILYKDLLSQIADQFHSDFYIIPCSIHEMILVPSIDKEDLPHFNALVKEVNDTKVIEDEILSDHAYFYSLQEDTISM